LSRSLRSGWIGLLYKIGPAKTGDSARGVFAGPARAGDICPDYRPVEDTDNGRRSPALPPLHQLMTRGFLLGSWQTPYFNRPSYFRQSSNSIMRPAYPLPVLSWQMRLLSQPRETELRRACRRARAGWRRLQSSRFDGSLPITRRYLRGSTRRTECNPSSLDRSGISRSHRKPVAGQTCHAGRSLSTDWQFLGPPQTDSCVCPSRLDTQS